MVIAVELPAESAGFKGHFTYLKLRDRLSYAFALVSVAAALELEGGVIRRARIALGGVAHKPWRRTEAEALLEGQPAEAAHYARAAEALLEGARGYAHNGFKIDLARRAIHPRAGSGGGRTAAEPCRQADRVKPMLRNDTHVGQPRNRVDGRLKVTGAAPYAAEFDAPGLLHAYMVTSAIAKGRISRIDASAAEALEGVVKVYTHENRPRAAWFSYSWRDQVGPPGSPFRPLYDADIIHSDQPIALVVAESFEIARYAAALVRVEYEPEGHRTDLQEERPRATPPRRQRSGISPPPSARGDVDKALKAAPARLSQDYAIATEHHNPMEPHATTVIHEADGKLVIHDKIQGVMNSQAYVTSVFGLSKDKVRVISPFLGGGFGSGLRPHFQLFLATMAALDLERSVRLELPRDQTFSLTHRPETINTVDLGAEVDGTLTALRHEAIAATSTNEEHQEVVVNWSGLVYPAPNAAFDYRLARLDISTPATCAPRARRSACSRSRRPWTSYATRWASIRSRSG